MARLGCFSGAGAALLTGCAVCVVSASWAVAAWLEAGIVFLR